jgi:NAD(P)-dependent dehydrogenase (short-subunit alcohol dehydrogenase family)
MGDATGPPPLPSPFKGWHTDTYPAIDPSRPELSLKGKSAIVSGGGGTIGSATVNALAKAGVSTIGIVGRTQKTLDEATLKLKAQHPGTKFVAFTADISSLPSLESAFKQIGQQAGNPVDILVHNAGHLAQPATITSSDPKEWWTSFEVNILGAFNSVRAFLPVASPNATIVNISTAAAHFPAAGISRLSAYSSSKLGALKVFEFVQAENPELHVVSLQPGVVSSDMNMKHGEMAPMDTRKYIK